MTPSLARMIATKKMNLLYPSDGLILVDITDMRNHKEVEQESSFNLIWIYWVYQVLRLR